MDMIDGKDIDVSINGSGDVEADKVQCIDVDVRVVGSGDTSVRGMC